MKNCLTLEYPPQLRLNMDKGLRTTSMRSGELAKAAGVSRDALRYYERHHLLPVAQRASNGYRSYPPQALARVQLIRAALGIGFTVAELAEIFSARDRGMAPCRQVHALAVEKAKRLRSRIAELTALHGALQAAIRSWSRKLKSTGAGKRAGLLEMFLANHPESTQAISPMMSPGLQRSLQKQGLQKRSVQRKGGKS
jgi:MerR family transcriptional regulator, copper efflux regulator